MKKRRNLWALTACVVLALGACSDEETTTTPPAPPGGTALPPVAVEGGLAEVAVDVAGTWTAVSDAHWCVPAAPEGSGERLTLSVLPNTTGRERTAHVSLLPGGTGRSVRSDSAATSGQIVITQEGDAGGGLPAGVYITALVRRPGALDVVLTATGGDGRYRGTEGLSDISTQPVTVLDPDVKLADGQPDTICIVGPDSWAPALYTVSGRENAPVEITVKTSPATQQRIVVDQTATIGCVVSSLPEAASGQVRFVHDGRLYFGGGLTQLSVSAGGTATQTETEYARAFYALDPATGSLTQLGDLPIGLSKTGCATPAGGKIYAIGASGVLYSYDTATDTWTQLDSPTHGLGDAAYGRGQAIYTVHASQGVIMGFRPDGTDVERIEFTPAGNVEVLAEDDGRVWMAADTLLYVHDDSGLHAVGSYDGIALVGAAGGRLVYRTGTETLALFDLETGLRESLDLFYHAGSAERSPLLHYGQAVMAGGTSYVIGGYNCTGALSWTATARPEVMRFDVENLRPYTAVVE